MKYSYIIIALLHMLARGESHEHHEHHEQYLSIEKWNKIADYVNNLPESTWKAVKLHSVNGDAFHHSDHRVGHSGGMPLQESAESDLEEREIQCEDNGLPKQFDARKHWPECASVIGHVYDQGTCGSWWAVSTAGVLSDRVCIASRGKKKAVLSSQQLISCCSSCSHGHGMDRCHGGWTGGAFQYMRRYGLVTGGDYKSKQGCQPYLIQPCDHNKPENSSSAIKTCSSLPHTTAAQNQCKKHCYNHSYDKKFKQDIIKADKEYKVGPCAAMKEIYKHGSILSNFIIYEDFYTYKSGVYQQLIGNLASRHAVRVIGWGEEKGVPYWLAINSWNTNWGDKGTFKIKRGGYEFSFEQGFSAVLPKF